MITYGAGAAMRRKFGVGVISGMPGGIFPTPDFYVVIRRLFRPKEPSRARAGSRATDDRQ